jgi:predicted house-cleaning NTP pyrophosphatase (Maf/HAM1 superfamily)
LQEGTSYDLVISCDSIVVCFHLFPVIVLFVSIYFRALQTKRKVFEGRILEKPTSRENAVEVLKSLSGKTHKVITSVTLILSAKYRMQFYRFLYSTLFVCIPLSRNFNSDC